MIGLIIVYWAVGQWITASQILTLDPLALP